MKRLHRQDLYGWSEFNEDRNIDFHGLLWVRPNGNILIDPVPMSSHDLNHLMQLGGATWIIITNSDHVRDAANIARLTGAQLAGPQAESATFPILCNRWLGEGDELVPGLLTLELQGSKTPGELALLLDNDTLVTGDLVRAHEGGRLCILPDPKLSDKNLAIASAQRLAGLPDIKAVLTGDGWPIFRDGHLRLNELLNTLKSNVA